MDQSAAAWAGASTETGGVRARPARWLRIRYRAIRVRRLTRRAEDDGWLDQVSPWAFWGLHR